MNVKQLIAQLKKMPPNLPVYTAAHDNHSHEVQGLVGSVNLLSKDDEEIHHHSDEMLNSMPKRWVTLR